MPAAVKRRGEKEREREEELLVRDPYQAGTLFRIIFEILFAKLSLLIVRSKDMRGYVHLHNTYVNIIRDVSLD